MTLTAKSARPPAPASSRARSWLLLAAPLVGLAWWPLWWGVGAAGVLAFTRAGRPAAGARLPLLLLLAGLGGVPGLLAASTLPESVAAARAALPLLLGAVLLSSGLWALESGRRPLGAALLGLLLLLGAGLGGGLPLALGLGLGAFGWLLALAGAPGPEDRALRPLGRGGAARRWLLVAGAGAGVLLAALSLPLPGVPGGTEAERRGGLSAVRALIGGQWGDVYALNRPLGSNGERRYPQGLGENPTHGYAPPAPSQFDNNRAFVGGLLVLLAFAWLLWRSRERRKGGGRPAWWEVAALAGVLLAGGLLVLGSLSGDPRSLEPSGGYAKLGVEGEKGLLTGGGNSSVLPTQGQGWLNRFNDVAFVLLLLAAVLLAWAGWRLNRPARPEEDAPAPLLAPTLEDATALHRVRRTYRSALAALTRAGLGRAPDETPAEHAARVSAARPDLAGALSDLLAAYTPVRYGLSSSEEGAERAEGAARTLARLARPTSAPGAAGSALG